MESNGRSDVGTAFVGVPRQANLDMAMTAPTDPLILGWKAIRIRIRPDLIPEEAKRLHLEAMNYASDLTWPISVARTTEAQAEQEHRRERNTAFNLSSAASDKKKEAAAQASVLVQIAEAKAESATIYRKLLEETRDNALTAHYALRGIAKLVSEDFRLTT